MCLCYCAWGHIHVCELVHHMKLWSMESHWCLHPRNALNSLSPGRCVCDLKCLNFIPNLGIDVLTVQGNSTMRWMAVDLAKIGSGNGLVLSGNQPLPEPVLTKIAVAIWHHLATILIWHCKLRQKGDELTHWGQVTHICVSKLTIIGSDNGLSPGTNAGILLIGPLGTNLSEISIGYQTFSFKKMHSGNVVCEMVSILSRPKCVNSLSPEVQCTLPSIGSVNGMLPIYKAITGNHLDF